MPALCKLDVSPELTKIVCNDTVMQWEERPKPTTKIERAKWDAYAAGGSLQKGERVYPCRFGKQPAHCRELDIVGSDPPLIHSTVAMAIFGDKGVVLSCGYPGKRQRKPPDQCGYMLEYTR